MDTTPSKFWPRERLILWNRRQWRHHACSGSALWHTRSVGASKSNSSSRCLHAAKYSNAKDVFRRPHSSDCLKSTHGLGMPSEQPISSLVFAIRGYCIVTAFAYTVNTETTSHRATRHIFHQHCVVNRLIDFLQLQIEKVNSLLISTLNTSFDIREWKMVSLTPAIPSPRTHTSDVLPHHRLVNITPKQYLKAVGDSTGSPFPSSKPPSGCLAMG
ncbi:hypothetical protein B0H21DRAFT_318259 [Amylocystis lapponica]|nr:hypothetical protein B0H21DRAFT_318259 [Amylocystis lapponica]